MKRVRQDAQAHGSDTVIPVVTLNAAGTVTNVSVPCGVKERSPFHHYIKQESILEYRLALNGKKNNAFLRLTLSGTYPYASLIAFGTGNERVLYLQLFTFKDFSFSPAEQAMKNLRVPVMTKISVIESANRMWETKTTEESELQTMIRENCGATRRYLRAMFLYRLLTEQQHLTEKTEPVDIGRRLMEGIETFREHNRGKQLLMKPASPAVGEFTCYVYAEELRMFLVPILHRMITESQTMLMITLESYNDVLRITITGKAHCDYERTKQTDPDWDSYFALRYEMALLCEKRNGWIVRKEERNGDTSLLLDIPMNLPPGALADAEGADYRKKALKEDITFYTKRGLNV